LDMNTEDENIYEMQLGMDKYQLRCFYTTMAKAYRNWAGGEPYEQELLKTLRDESWRLLLESQFD